jgi:hypothetical protein
MNEILRALTGASRLALRDQNGMAYFDPSFEGFWRSFIAYALVLPPAIVLAVMRPETAGDVDRIILAKALAFAASVIAFPVAMIAVARAFDLRAHYVPFIVAYNWSQAIVVLAAVGIAVLDKALRLTRGMEITLSVLLLIWSLYYLWFIARTALRASAQLAAAVTALEFALSFTVQAAVESSIQS